MAEQLSIEKVAVMHFEVCLQRDAALEQVRQLEKQVEELMLKLKEEENGVKSSKRKTG